MPATNSSGAPIPDRPSVLSRFRLAGAGLIVAIGVVGALFYGWVQSHYLGAIIGRTLGPYSDTLADYGFGQAELEVWGRIAARHGVAILVEPSGGPAVAYDARGRPSPPAAMPRERLRAVRTAADGTRVTLYWALEPFGGGHLPLMGGLLFMVVAVVGSAFWFLHRQLAPLSSLHTGVEAVARGDFDARVAVIRDDEIGRVAAAFNDMARRVGETIADRERLLADVSHELRSPVARMKVALELLPEGAKRDTVARDLKEMEKLIAALLERQQLLSLEGRLEAVAIDLVTVAGEVAAVFAGSSPGVVVAGAGALTAQADPALIRSLLHNLVDNAVKFSLPESGPVVVELERLEGRAVVRVIDDGIGIPAEGVERLFEPFVKLGRARGHRIGYGIGLDLCRRVVRSHGGSIRLRPRRPRGTEAVVSLPDGAVRPSAAAALDGRSAIR